MKPAVKNLVALTCPIDSGGAWAMDNLYTKTNPTYYTKKPGLKYVST
jgi:hypothetical protein